MEFPTFEQAAKQANLIDYVSGMKQAIEVMLVELGITGDLRREMFRVRDEHRWHAQRCASRKHVGLPFDETPPIRWNPGNKVVQDHRDGTMYPAITNYEREARGLPVPWTPMMGENECFQPPIE